MSYDDSNENAHYKLPRSLNMVDITQEISDCAASLSESDPFLCNSHTFSLHDAMSATQLMDKKMDCCEIPASQAIFGNLPMPPQDKMIAPRPLPTGLKDDFTSLPWEDLNVDDAACIGFEILVRLQSLFSGSSIEESTFTCLYAHCSVLQDMRRYVAPESLEVQFQGLAINKLQCNASQYAVFAMSLASVQITDVFRGIVQNADIYEEEDFVSNSSELVLFTDVEEVNIYRILEAALKLVSDNNSLGAQIMLHTLGYLLGTLSMLSKLAKIESSEVENVANNIKYIGEMTVKKLEQLRKCMANFAYHSSEKAQAVLRICFDPYLNRPLLGNAPVRKTRVESQADVITSLVKVTSEVSDLVCTLLLKGSTIGRICRILNKHNSKNINILSRSLIILNLYFDEKLLGMYDLRQLVLDNIRQLCYVPDDLLQNSYFDALLVRMSKPIYDMMKLLVLNQNRQRSFIEAIMLQDWIDLQADAQLVDASYRKDQKSDQISPPYITYYTMYILIDILDRHLSSAIALGLFYQHIDISFAYWYRHYLLSAQLNQYTKMRSIKQSAKSIATNIDNKKQKRKPNRKQNGNVSDVLKLEEDGEDESAFVWLGLKRMLCSGLLRFIAALLQAGILENKVYEFTSARKIFEKRFELYKRVRQPPALTYEDYLEGSDFSRVSQDDLIKSTLDMFQNCKTTVEQMLKSLPLIDSLYSPIDEPEIRALFKVCVGNLVYLHRLQQIVKGPDVRKVAVTFDFDIHKEFCTIKLA